MRLIDSDALYTAIENEFDGVCVYDVSQSEVISDFERVVDNVPTINAIPVDSLLEYIEAQRSSVSPCEDARDAGYLDCLDNLREAILDAEGW